MPLSPTLRAQATYPFVRLNEAAAARRAAGLEVIDLGMGDPREPTDPAILAALRDGVRERTLEITYQKDKVNAGQVLGALTADGLGIVDVSTRDPDLEDVFLSLVAAG